MFKDKQTVSSNHVKSSVKVYTSLIFALKMHWQKLDFFLSFLSYICKSETGALRIRSKIKRPRKINISILIRKVDGELLGNSLKITIVQHYYIDSTSKLQIYFSIKVFDNIIQHFFTFLVKANDWTCHQFLKIFAFAVKILGRAYIFCTVAFLFSVFYKQRCRINTKTKDNIVCLLYKHMLKNNQKTKALVIL